MNKKGSSNEYSSAPNKTFFALSFPVLFSLVAEPVTGLVDTAFVARLGSPELAALGVGTLLFSSAFWMFGFLGVGTQTEVAGSLGADDGSRAARIATMATVLGVLLGVAVILLGFSGMNFAIALLTDHSDVHAFAVDYMGWRLLGAPAVLTTMAAFGALRGAQDMRTPLYVAVGVNALNVVLDWLLVFGYGPIPALGVGGAALASTISQWIGAFWVGVVLFRRIGLSSAFRIAECRRLFSIGGDMFIRTGAVIALIMLCSRVANHAGVNEGAVFQGIRQFFIFSAMLFDAFAITGQSLIAYYVGQQDVATARRVAKTTVLFSLGAGIIMGAGMLAAQGQFAWLLIPSEAHAVFYPAWLTLALIQPLTALAFSADGINWGTGEFTYLRNAMIISCIASAPIVLGVEYFELSHALVWIWIANGVHMTVRTALGLGRVWPGSVHAPLGKA